MTRALIAYDHEIFVQQQFGGISRYFVELAVRIPRVSPWLTRVLAPAHINSYLRDKPELVTGVYLTPRMRGAGRLSRTLSGLALPLLTRRLRPALMHRTYYSPQPSPGSTCRTIVTVHDMIHELFASEFAPGDATSANKRRAVAQADQVICVSESTKNDLMTLFDVPAHKISVIHLGHSDVFRSDGPTLPASEAPRPYILYVGQRAGYKGFAEALAVYAASRTLSSSFDFLAFGGQPFGNSEHALIASLRLREGAVRRLAGSDDVLSRAYRGAQALIYPSRYEGFGIPPLEAMSSGCPVACANTSSLPEVVGEAALCFDPDDMDAMRATLERVCLDASLRAAMIDAGLHRAKAFSWDRCARQTAAVYAAVLRA